MWGLFDVNLFSVNHKGEAYESNLPEKMANGVSTFEEQNKAFSQGQKRAYDCKFPAMWPFHFCLFIYWLADESHQHSLKSD